MTTSSLVHVTGNLLDLAEQGEFDVIVHGCNCFHAMGGGIAREIAQRYPGAAEADRTRSGPAGLPSKLGTWTSYFTGKFEILNAYTQYQPSSGEDVFEYGAFQEILDRIVELRPEDRVGLPYIGMGLARGDTNRILAMIEDFAEKMSQAGGSVTLVEFG